MTTVKDPLVVVAVFLWIGFICAISFMEAWLKFRAEGVTLPIGLSIGRIVFKALNRVEWVLAVSVAVCILLNPNHSETFTNVLFIFILVLLITQTIWLLPALDKRVVHYIQQLPLQPSNLHRYFIITEVTKTVCLVAFGLLHFKSN
ncbi:hypothetical protein KJS94_08930 [Flavihumibacter rivuli]|uniref:hypothetical protein n=1 Tax=Flavihumibacter rivuli TaxID=2838156 RepID=UPI001BDF4663|nr:hypothetical protein [Flavihumibacter rivuli]ULQ58317.1 hypothetical protein KJS94_08930 [Flavihumibacter rivuli]